MSSLAAGDKAPDFELETDGGGTLHLADHAGTPVVLFFYPKDDTSGCTKEAIQFTELKAQFDALPVMLVGISPDSAQKHDKFKAKHALTVTLAADVEKTVCESYGVWIEKSMYGRKYMGVERSTYLINADGNIAEIWRKVKVPGHAEAVLKAASAL